MEPPKDNPEKMGKKSLFLPVTVILILILLFIIGLIPRIIHWNQLKTPLNHPLSVTLMTLKPDKQPIELVLPSTTQALRITPIWARTNGYIKNFYVDIGDSVDQGQLMLEIDTPEVEQELLQAKADFSTALAKLKIAQISAERWRDLFSANSEAVSPQEVDEKKTDLQASFAEVDSARASMQRLEKIRDFNRLYAPFKGIITERLIDIGSLVTAGSQEGDQQLFQIAETNIIRVFASVPQSYFRFIKVGGTADILIEEYPGKVFKGVIARTSRSLDPVSRTLLTEIHVDNKDGELIIGLYATVHFKLIPELPYFIIPTNALIIRDGNPKVAVVDPLGKVRLQMVKIGRDFGKTIEIISGLKEKENIITNPTDRIYDGLEIDQKVFS